ncbi:protein GLE1-like [Prunus avium]|uniref:Protein GLE1-like n=1 Tax=Prunus avium TaxID=42229 RepID=A0A6P5RVS8_PRUAV|nr:protein GLE1-like [Prunus avium]
MRSVRRCFKSFTTLKISSLAEALNNHLAAVQRDHEVRSQIEERKIRIDGAYEDAKRKENSLQEEKLRQDKNELKEAEVTYSRQQKVL